MRPERMSGWRKRRVWRSRSMIRASAAQRPRNPGLLRQRMLAANGILNLEIEGIFTQMGIDPERLYQAEIDKLIAQRIGHR